MSFNGYFFVARSPLSITALPSVRRSLRQAAGGGVLVDDILGYRRDGDWQLLQCDADGPPVTDLVADTEAPALVIFTLESEIADVRGATPTSPAWFAILNPEGGRHYGAPDAGPVEQVSAVPSPGRPRPGLWPTRRASRRPLECGLVHSAKECPSS